MISFIKHLFEWFHELYWADKIIVLGFIAVGIAILLVIVTVILFGYMLSQGPWVSFG